MCIRCLNAWGDAYASPDWDATLNIPIVDQARRTDFDTYSRLMLLWSETYTIESLIQLDNRHRKNMLNINTRAKCYEPPAPGSQPAQVTSRHPVGCSRRRTITLHSRHAIRCAAVLSWLHTRGRALPVGSRARQGGTRRRRQLDFRAPLY